MILVHDALLRLGRKMKKSFSALMLTLFLDRFVIVGVNIQTVETRWLDEPL